MKLGPSSLPIVASLAEYRKEWLSKDISSGLAVAAVGLPSAIAYPAIAGLPPEVGLYSSIVPLIGYALFGPSRRLVVGPDAATMTVLAAVLIELAPPDPATRVQAAAAIALLVGVLCLLGRLLRLGVVASFLSRPILVGFMTGIALSILIGQIGRFTGVKIEADGLIAPILELAQKSDLVHWPSVALGVGMLGLILLLKTWRFPVPAPLVAVVLAVVLSAVFDLQGLGIKVVGDIPSGMLAFSFPFPLGLPLQQLVAGALAIWLVSFSAGIVTARSFGAMANERIDANGELVGFGAANIVSGLFSGFPVTASDSRTATNHSIGGKTQLVSITAALTLLAVLVYLNDALKLLPTPALGAILVAASLSLIDLRTLRDIWHVSRMEFAFALIGMAGALGLGVLAGVAVAIGATLLYLLIKGMRPRDAMLGRIPGRDGFYKLHRSPAARPIPGVAICLVQGSLLFYNVDYIRERIEAIAADQPADTRWFILDASAIAQLDGTAAAVLGEICEDLRIRGVRFGIAELHSEPLDILERAGVADLIGRTMIFDDLEEAMAAYELCPDSSFGSPAEATASNDSAKNQTTAKGGTP